MNVIADVKAYIHVLAQCPLFDGITESELPDALHFLNACVRSFAKGETIFPMGSPLRVAGLVLEGGLECSFDNEHADRIIMNHFRQGQLFGLSMACAQSTSCPMFIRAVADCTVLFLDYQAVMLDRPLEHLWQTRLVANCIRGLARQNVFLNLKVRIMAQHGVRDRVCVYLRSLQPQLDGRLHTPFSRTALAEFLGVNRSALSRELKRMADEGLIEVEGRSFRLARDLA